MKDNYQVLKPINCIFYFYIIKTPKALIDQKSHSACKSTSMKRYHTKKLLLKQTNTDNFSRILCKNISQYKSEEKSHRALKIQKLGNSAVAVCNVHRVNINIKATEMCKLSMYFVYFCLVYCRLKTLKTCVPLLIRPQIDWLIMYLILN